MNSQGYIANILGTSEEEIKKINSSVIEKIAKENEAKVKLAIESLSLKELTKENLEIALVNKILKDEKNLLLVLEKVEGGNNFEKSANLARQIAKVGNGFFLKKENASEILKKRKPENLLNFLGLSSVEEALSKHDVTELFSALRFVESDSWMHETFEVAYSAFTARDFEERPIEIKVLGPEWKEIGEKFVAKKHHNVSHLKEFGVIFLNPIAENIPGKFIRDFALLLHYFHEIEFYSKLFKHYSLTTNFPKKLKALLRGDVLNVREVDQDNWLIVQRYLFKENPNDPRLLLRRVNPESMHWTRGERDLAYYQKLNLGFWEDNMAYVGLFIDGKTVSFDLEDAAMSAVSFSQGGKDTFNYHQREAMWTKIFSELVRGDENMENILIENFDKGVVKV